jgi:hypothetical protein
VPIPWHDDPPGSDTRIVDNLRRVGGQVVADAALRLPPTLAMAQEWHRETYRGVPLPVPYYGGEIRDTDPIYPELLGYEVSVGTVLGMPSADVPAALARFEAGIQAVIARMDGVIAVGARPAVVTDLYAILEIAALAHGEWVRIHPFANGNGRIARLWVNWVAVRYGLPFFLALEPRPASLTYAAAAAASMRGDHRPMVAALLTLLNRQI